MIWKREDFWEDEVKTGANPARGKGYEKDWYFGR